MEKVNNTSDDLVTALRQYHAEEVERVNLLAAAADALERLEAEVAHLRKTCADFGVHPAKMSHEKPALKEWKFHRYRNEEFDRYRNGILRPEVVSTFAHTELEARVG